MKNTEKGRQAWGDSGKALNIGDLSMQDLAPINYYLRKHGIRIVSLEVDSLDARPDQWVFDDVLVEEF